MKTKSTPRSFKAWPENEERLVFADKVGLNVSEVVNEVLKKGLRAHLESKLVKIREAVSVPVP